MPKDHWGYEKEEKPDIVEVVRCKNCKHTNARTEYGNNVHCGIFVLWMDNDFYCKHGKRKDK